jgi:hypothetical protein
MSWDLSSEEVICSKLENQQRTIEMFSRKIKALEEKLKVAVEALESVAFLDEPEADTAEYWAMEGFVNIPETMATDTKICREALEKIKGGK